MEPPVRKIIHVDMDAFYASVEQHDHPELKGKPIAVGYIHRGVVTTASYEAREYGVHSAMSSKIAKEKCPDLIFVVPRFDRYHEVSRQIRQIFYEFTDLVEPLSLDEAYLDVTVNKKNISSANELAKMIRQEIWEKTGLTASAGISINKFLAKVASDIRKPNGQKTIHPEQVLEFLEKLPIEKFYGIGKVTATKMKRLGIHNGKDLKAKTLEELMQWFGKTGKHYYSIVRGIQFSEVTPHKIQKSVAVEETFWDDLQTEEVVFAKIEELTTQLMERLEKRGIKGKTITLKIKYEDFTLFTRSKTQTEYFENKFAVSATAKQLWNLRPFHKPVRLLGLSLTKLNTGIQKRVSIQLSFPFDDFG